MRDLGDYVVEVSRFGSWCSIYRSHDVGDGVGLMMLRPSRSFTLYRSFRSPDAKL